MKNYFPAINLLRVISCIIIVLFHWYPIANGGIFARVSLIDFVVRNGGIMVNLFFVISGFCMAANYKERVMSGMGFKEYFLRHYLKFVALALITTPIGVISCWLGGVANLPTIPFSFSELIREILCIRCGWMHTASMPYNGPIWFVNVLLIMYIFYYFCCKSKGYYVSFCILFLLVGLFMHYDVNVIYLPLITDFTHTGLYNFFAGTVLYELYDMCKDSDKKIFLWGAVFGAGTVIVTILQLIVENEELIGNVDVVLLFTVWPFLIWTAIFFKPFISLAETRGLKWFHKLTTSIYVWHNPLAYILFYCVVIFDLPIILDSPLVFACYVGIVLIVASISNKYIENKVFKLLVYMTENNK